MAGFCRLGGVGCVLSQLSTVAASAGVVVEAVRWQWVGGCNGPESRRKIWELGPTNKTVHLSFAVDWSKEVNPLLSSHIIICNRLKFQIIIHKPVYNKFVFGSSNWLRTD